MIGDAVQLNQILTNLLGNAIKFTDKGGVTLGIGLWTDAHILWNLAPGPWTLDQKQQGLEDRSGIFHKTAICFSVVDTGIGIAPEQLSRVFESFQQADDDISANYGGTGLGLSITKDLVEQQGGKIVLERTEGKGTCIAAIIPFVLDEYLNVEDQTITPPKIAFENLPILLVEDTFFNQMLAIELLKSRIPGVTIKVAENGQVALEKLETDALFDLVLMDVKMPVMDGLEATRRIRAQSKWKKLPIIALTANAVQEELDKCRAAGIDAYATKPIDTEERFATMLKVMG